MDAEHLRDLIANAAQGIERGHGFLEYHGDARSAQRAHRGLIHLRQVTPFKQDAAARNAHIAGQQAHDGTRHHGFAGTAFPDHAQDFSGVEIKRYLT